MKKESLLTSMLKLILVVSLIVGIGALLGALGYFGTMPKSEVVINNEIENKKIEDSIIKTEQKEELDIKTGRGELDEGIDVVKLQEEVDEGNQSWKLRYGCMGCTDEEVKNAVAVPMRVESESVLKEIGKSFGFKKEELDNFNLEKTFSEKGKKVYKIYHNSDLYILTLTQPVIDYYKVWIISRIESYKKECNPKLIGIEIENKVNRIFEEKEGKLEQIISPEQFKERGYSEYCIIWRNITNLSADIIDGLPKSDLLEQAISSENHNLYKNNIIGFQFYYPKEWSYQEYRNGNYISFKNGIFSAPLEVRIDFFGRSGQWAIQNIHSIVVDGQKTYFLESGNEWSVKTRGVITGKAVSYLTRIPVSGHDLYLEYVFSYNPQSEDANQIIQKHKNIFSSILSSFKFIEKDEMKILSPNTGEIWKVGKNYDILWKPKNEYNRIDIRLYNNDASDNATRLIWQPSNVPNAGKYEFQVFENIENGDRYQFSITEFGDNDSYNIESGEFSIVKE